MSKKIERIALALLITIALAYSAQFFWGAMHKGQSNDDFAWEVLAHEALSRQYSGIPQMRIAGSAVPPNLCDYWNFEGFWGRCVTIGLNVRDYKPEHLPIVEREVARLASQLRKPCALVSTLDLPDASNLRRKLGCGGFHKTFKLQIGVTSVTVAYESASPDRPNRWFPKTAEKLISYHFEGEF
jgi:hypothetical protein